RIDDALRRIAGGTSEPTPFSAVERFVAEENPRIGKDQVGFHPTDMRRSVSRQSDSVVPSPDPVEPGAQADADVVDEKLIDVQLVANYLWFVAKSVQRHKLLTVGTFGLALALTVAAILVMPKTYHVQAKLLAQRNEVMTALS